MSRCVIRRLGISRLAVGLMERFFAQESCGWCKPCWSGLNWAARMLEALENKMQALTQILDAQIDILSRSTGEQVLALSSALAGAIDFDFA